MGKILKKKTEYIFYFLLSRGLFIVEEKQCRKGTRGTRDLEYIDQYILKERKAGGNNLAVSRNEYEKTYDIVSQSGIVECLKCTRYQTKKNEISEKYFDFARDLIHIYPTPRLGQGMTQGQFLSGV